MGKKYNRFFVIDIETTGFDKHKERILEIAAVEMIGGVPSGREFHSYVNPEGVPVSRGALRVHGISNDIVADAPLLTEVLMGLHEFIGEEPALLVAHNGDNFDIPFINIQAARVDVRGLEAHISFDTLKFARRMAAEGVIKKPERGFRQDELCRYFGIDISSRANGHGALIDARLLAQLTWFLKYPQAEQAFVFPSGESRASLDTGQKPEP